MRRIWAALSAASAVAAACTAPSETRPLTTVVIENVDVVTVEEGVILEGQDVVITGNRITSVVAAGDTRIPEGAQVLNGTGRYLIPGLWDMHVNMWDERLMHDVLFPMFIANGVLGVREMGGDTMQLRLRDMILSGAASGPRMVVGGLIEGPHVTGAWRPYISVSSEEEGRRAVDSLKAVGFDFVKSHDDFIPLAGYRGALSRAQEVGMEVSGHVPASIDVLEAASLGHRTIEHLTGLGIACSSRAAELLQAYSEQARSVGDAEARTRLFLRSEVEPLRDFDPALCENVYRDLGGAGSWVVPTLVRREIAAVGQESALLQDPALLLVGGTMESAAWMWDWVPEGLLAPVFEHWVGAIGHMRNAGLGVLAGTDVSDVAGGLALHHELQLLVQGGMTPIEALRAATLEPARYLGASDSIGLVEPGYLADLVLLDANPLEAIGNTRNIAAVILRGEVFDRTQLDSLLTNARVAMDTLRARVVF